MEIFKMCKSISECRDKNCNVPRNVNGLEAWIFFSEMFGTYAVRFYAPGAVFPGYSFQSEHDGSFSAVERL